MKRRLFLIGAATAITAPVAPVAAVASSASFDRNAALVRYAKMNETDLSLFRKDEFIERAVRQPMLTGHDMKNQPVSITPGRVTYVSAGSSAGGFWPLI